MLSLLGSLLIAGCAQPGRQGGPPSAAPAGPAPDLSALLDPTPPLVQAFNNMDSVALVPPDLKQVVVEGLRVITRNMSGLSAEVGDDAIVLKFAEHPARSFSTTPRKADAWARQAGDMLRFIAAEGGKESATVPKRLIAGFLLGGLVALKDPQASLSISGIPPGPEVALPGLMFRRVEGRLRLCAVHPPIRLDGTGVTIGAELIEIEGSAIDAPQKLYGPAGTSVKLTVADARGRHTAEFPRGFTDDGDYRRIGPDKDLAYIRPPQFGVGAGYGALSKVRNLIAASEGPLKAIILDLRCHPGGLLKEAIAFAEGFLDQGQPIAFTEGRHREAAQSFIAFWGVDKPLATPLVVLVNGGTSSAAELVAAALAEQDRGLLIGSTTSGEAGIRSILPIKDIGHLGLTWATMLTAKRRPFIGTGLKPDVCLDSDGIGRADPNTLRKPACGRWIARDGDELAYAEWLLTKPDAASILSLRSTAAAQ